MEFIDTHAHPHMEGYELSPDEFIDKANRSDVMTIVCIGTEAEDSRRAIEFAKTNPGCYASIGLHPHEAKLHDDQKQNLARLVTDERVVAVGECGLDYYYEHSPRDNQKSALRGQIELAVENDLPLVFHVREAFEDFFAIFDEYAANTKIRGVVHSFTADKATAKACMDRGLYVGLNGIMTFTKDDSQLDAAKYISLGSLVLETDAPFLTPVPFRGKVNDSGHVRTVAEFLANLRGESLEDIARATTQNAKELFRI